MRLTTEQINYDLVKDIAHYPTKGEIKDGENKEESPLESMNLRTNGIVLIKLQNILANKLKNMVISVQLLT